MALFASLGYKEDSTPRRNNRNDGFNDYSSTPYGMQSNQSQQIPFNNTMNNQSFNLNNNNNQNQSQQFRNRSQSQNGRNPYNINNNNNGNNLSSSLPFNNNNIINQENDNFLSNNPSSTYNQNRSSTNSFLLNNNNISNSPNRGKDNKTMNRSSRQNGKYSSLPRQSIRSSGIGFVSPVPSKFQPRDNNELVLSHNNNLELSQNNLTQNGDGQQSMGISPIKPSFNNNNMNDYNNNNNTLPLDQTLNLSRGFGHESRLSLYNENQVKHPTQIMVIGFPSGEAQFIHRKFRTYGDILKSKWSENTLFLEYKHELQAKRALSQNTKWIKHENLNYMIAVTFAEFTDINPSEINNNNNNNNGRYVNVTEMYNETFNNPDHNLPSYWGQNIDPIERQSVLQSGPTSNFWKVVHFLGSGW